MSEINANEGRELNDQELENVHGGSNYATQNGYYYEYIGSNWPGSSDWDKCYLCPNCGRPVHYGAGFRYYCDPCDESWFFVDKLKLNLDQGMWRGITREKYIEKTGDNVDPL